MLLKKMEKKETMEEKVIKLALKGMRMMRLGFKDNWLQQKVAWKRCGKLSCLVKEFKCLQSYRRIMPQTLMNLLIFKYLLLVKILVKVTNLDHLKIRVGSSLILDKAFLIQNQRVPGEMKKNKQIKSKLLQTMNSNIRNLRTVLILIKYSDFSKIILFIFNFLSNANLI